MMAEINPVLEFDLRVEQAVHRSIHNRKSKQTSQLNITFAELRNCLTNLKSMGLIDFVPDYEVYRKDGQIAVEFNAKDMKKLFDYGDIQESYNYDGITGDSLGLSSEGGVSKGE
jgi:hypothetical protein